MNTAFPFTDLDVNKIFAPFKAPAFDTEAVAEAGRRNVAAWQEAGKLVADGFQAVAKRQAELVQESFDAALAGTREVLEAATPEDCAKCQAALAQKTFETQAASARELAELGATTSGQALQVLNQRFLDGMDELVKATAPKAAKAPKTAKKA